MYGEILAPYLADPTSVFIISSDFCHWGTRFNYTYYLPSPTSSENEGRVLKSGDRVPRVSKDGGSNDSLKIHESIGVLDRMAMDAVESGRHEAFTKILRDTGNTVCGRHPIGVVMAAIQKVGEGGEKGGVGSGGDGGESAGGMKKGRFKFVRYERSSDCESVRDSSVSYASAFAIL